MLRRNFLKVLGAMGAVAAFPLEAVEKIELGKAYIKKAKQYPNIKYEVDYIPQKLCHLHKVHGEINGENWIVFEYTDDKVLPNDVFLKMINEINKKL